MERDLKNVLGFILGQIYRTQKHIGEGICPVTDAAIYGLLNGIEPVIDEHLGRETSITEAQLTGMLDVLSEYDQSEEKMKTLTGFYTIERVLQEKGIDRSDAIGILKYLKANDQFIDLIEKFDTSNSPQECRHFDLNQWDI